MKSIAWLGDSLDRLREASKDIRADAGYQLDRVQNGKDPDDFRPMPDVGPGAMEIRLHGGSEYRVFYVAQFAEAVYILHAFTKKTQATRKADLELGRQRYRAMLALRSQRKAGS